MADLRPERIDLEYERANLRSGRADFRPEKADSWPGRLNGEGKNRQTYKQTKVPLCSTGPLEYRTFPSLGPMPKKQNFVRSKVLEISNAK